MQVSVGTLVAFTMVAISVLILRYVPPDEVPLPLSFQGAIDSVSLLVGKETPVGYPLVKKAAVWCNCKFIL